MSLGGIRRGASRRCRFCLAACQRVVILSFDVWEPDTHREIGGGGSVGTQECGAEKLTVGQPDSAGDDRHCSGIWR